MLTSARLIATASLLALGLGFAATSDSPAAPAGAAITGVAAPAVSDVRYVRRHGRVCYRKCYREFVIGRRVCRTFC